MLGNPKETLRALDILDGEERLLAFTRRLWPVLEPHTPFVEGWALNAICEHLEAVTDGEITRLLMNVPPGFMKSLMTNVFWPAWEWGPQLLAHHRFVTFSYAASLTERDNRRFLDLLKSPDYQYLWGDRFELKKAGETLVSNDKTGWKLASSVGGVGTGERGDRILLDDPHNVKESESEVVRSETVRWFREAMSNRLNDMEKSAIVVIMQRVHEADVSGAIIESAADYTHLMIPMEYDGRRYTTSIGWTDPRNNDGELAWPERFPASVVSGIKAIGGPYAYSGQYQQAPTPRGGGIFRREWWHLWGNEDDPSDIRNRSFPACEYIVASLDPAYTEKEENDYSALTIWGVFRDDRALGDYPRIILLHAWRGRLALHAPDIERLPGENAREFTQRLEANEGLVGKTADLCKRFKVDRLLIEAKANGLTVAQEMRRLHVGEGWAVQLVDPKGDKVARAYAVQPLFSDEMVYAPYRKYSHGEWGDREWCDMVITEMASFPRAPHDDLTDSATQALSHLRRIGFAVHEVEVKREETEQMMFRPEPRPLYPV